MFFHIIISSDEIAHAALEAGDYVIAPDRLVLTQRDRLGPRAVDGDGPALGSTVQTMSVPALSQSWTFSSTSSPRSFGETTTTARSGANGTYSSGFAIAANRSLRTKAISGPRTVSGSRSRTKPVPEA